MRTVILGPPPPEIDALIARRRALGNDRRDEVWEGDYHMNPAPRRFHAVLVGEMIAAMRNLIDRDQLSVLADFNVGVSDNFRIPDCGVIVRGPDAVYLPTAELAVEIRSPWDETYAKFPHYAAHGVRELLIVDADARRIDAYALVGDRYREVGASAVLGIAVEALQAQIDWPA
jgi:hypothetical protein